MNFLTDVNLIKHLLDLTFEFKHIIQFNNKFPTDYFIDTQAYFEKTQDIATYFTPPELFDIVRSLTTIKSIINFFKNEFMIFHFF